MYTIRLVTADELSGSANGPDGPDSLDGLLGGLLADTVGAGASVGFLSPLDRAAAAGWWRALAPDVAAGRLLLWVAEADGTDATPSGSGSASGNGNGRIAGTVQLRPAATANGLHRGEVAKLMVHRAHRGRGLAGRLLAALESAAAGRGLRTLVLDTETDSPAERMYAAAGWTRVGTVPDFATDPAGVPRATTIFYKVPTETGAGTGDASLR
ncbi:GNAT family N-acetyltransferase [Kitasatospora sp. NPDC002551]|uniref:GNAT family N-acetyltransferase n=1 Tax=Kitasatospora sp. NPDC002551 TaxID=3154539 RepID=UPI00332CA81D